MSEYMFEVGVGRGVNNYLFKRMRATLDGALGSGNYDLEPKALRDDVLYISVKTNRPLMPSLFNRSEAYPYRSTFIDMRVYTPNGDMWEYDHIGDIDVFSSEDGIMASYGGFITTQRHLRESRWKK